MLEHAGTPVMSSKGVRGDVESPSARSLLIVACAVIRYGDAKYGLRW